MYLSWKDPAYLNTQNHWPGLNITWFRKLKRCAQFCLLHHQLCVIFLTHYFLHLYSLAASSSAGLCGKVSLWGMLCGKTEAVCPDMSGRPPIVIFCSGMSDLNCCSGDCRTSCSNCESLTAGIKVWLPEGIICHSSFQYWAQKMHKNSYYSLSGSIYRPEWQPNSGLFLKGLEIVLLILLTNKWALDGVLSCFQESCIRQ